VLRRLTFGSLVVVLGGLTLCLGLIVLGAFIHTAPITPVAPQVPTQVQASPLPVPGTAAPAQAVLPTPFMTPVISAPADETVPTPIFATPAPQPSAPPLQAFQAPISATIQTIFNTPSGQPVTITWPGAPGISIQFQVSTDLVTWSALVTVQVDPSGQASYTFTPTRTAYYRAYSYATGQLSAPARGVVVVGGLWSGYVVGDGPYTAVTGTFTVPNLVVSSTETAMAEWVGIDGVGVGPNTPLIQAGVLEQTVPGTNAVKYRAWWEVLPDDPTTVHIPWGQVSVLPGHRVTVTIWQVSGPSWGITLTDDTTGQNYTRVRTYTGPHQSAEWIVEAPVNTTAGSVYTLGHYVPDVTFSNARFIGPRTLTEGLSIVQGGATVSVSSALSADSFTVGYGSETPAAP